MQKPHKTTLAIDIVIFTIVGGTLNVLLIKRTYGPYTGFWALPGGFLKNNESIYQAAVRILKEKAGIQKVYVEQLYTFDASGRDPRGNIPTIAYFALTPKEKIHFGNGKKLQTPRFYPVANLPRLAFDHKNMIAYARKRLSAKLEYTNVVYALLPKQFRIFDLQKIYEEVLGKKLNKRNFQKKILSQRLIKTTGKVLRGGHHRPARLYKFINRKPAKLNSSF